MAQPSPRVCVKCQSPIDAGIRYCLNCGYPTDPERGRATEAASFNNAPPAYGGYQPPPNNYPAPGVQNQPPPGQNMPGIQQAPLPPNTGAPFAQSASSGSLYSAPNTGSGAQLPPVYGQYAPPDYNTPNAPMPPSYASNNALSTPPPPPVVPYSPYPAYDPNVKPRSRKRLYTIIAGVVIAALALTGILYAVLNHSSVPGVPGIASGPAASEQLNLTTVYSSDQLTITSVQQAANYSDDKLTYQSYTNLVRVNMKETQLSKHASFFSYLQAFRLILPDKSVISPEKSQAFTAPETDVVRNNWVDFGLNAKYDLSKLVLRLGADDEAQMLIPLQPNADLSKYQPKTASPNRTITYSGVNWTFQTASQGLSADGTQAKTGQVYITVSLIASNPGSDDFFGYDFLRLQSGSTVASQTTESSLSMPDDIKPGTTNIPATASFLVPVSTNYTLIFIANNSGLTPVDQVTIPFTM